MSFQLINQKISQKLALVYVHDNTLTNPDFTFTAKELSKVFGCSIQSAINVMARLRTYSDISAIGELKRDNYQIFKISEAGKKYAEKVKSKLELDDMRSTIEASKAGVTA